MQNKNNEFLIQYNNNKKLYDSFCHSMYALLNNLIEVNKINIHTITCRIKDEKSLLKKIEKKNGKYQYIYDITDIVGLRVITYFEDEVNKIADLIEREFKVDRENSIDKRDTTEPNQFGYMSLHLVIELNDSRKNLSEYKRFGDIKAEIQIRTILQHAWAEVEHDLGYKSNVEVPRSIRRDFSRVASLLETADRDFVRIKNDLVKYESEIDKKIELKTEMIFLDKISLSSYIRTNNMVNKIENDIKKFTNKEIGDSDSLESSLLGYLQYCNINTIEELDKKMNESSDLITFIASNILKTSHGNISRGISIFYLVYCEILKYKDEETFTDFFERFNFTSEYDDYDFDESDFESNISFTDRLYKLYEQFNANRS